MPKRDSVHDHAHVDGHDRGLAHDMSTLLQRASRRDLLRWIAGASLIPLIGCTSDDNPDPAPDARPDGGDGACSQIPEETAGPYPGDGSNGANALVLSGIVRSDITSSIAGATGVAAGVPLTVVIEVVDAAGACAALAGRAVYLWHCDREGRYSMYSAPITGENYLRGVQETAADGTVSFTTVFPGCYDGRMPHIHFEVYPSLASATASSAKVATSQLAFPTADCEDVYAIAGYETSVANLARISFATDNVFRDGVDSQLATVTGDPTAGYTARLRVAIG